MSKKEYTPPVRFEFVTQLKQIDASKLPLFLSSSLLAVMIAVFGVIFAAQPVGKRQLIEPQTTVASDRGTYQLFGRVVDQEGRGIPGAIVSSSVSADIPSTDSDGYYHLRAVLDGSEIIVYATGFFYGGLVSGSVTGIPEIVRNQAFMNDLVLTVPGGMDQNPPLNDGSGEDEF